MPGSGTELVVAGHEAIEPNGNDGDVLAQVEQARAALPSLIGAGDTDTLKRWRDEGKAASLAARKMHLEEESIALGRQAIRCAAALGFISARSGKTEPRSTRNGDDLAQRALGAAMDRGRLEAVLDELHGRFGIQFAGMTASRMGMGGVRASPVATLIRKRAAERGMSLIDLGREAGLPRGRLNTVVGAKRLVMTWWPARNLTMALGIDISNLEPMRWRDGSKPHPKSKAKWLTHRFRPGAGRWDEVGVRMIAMRDEMTRARSDWPDVPLLYEAMHTISDIVQREIRASENAG